MADYPDSDFLFPGQKPGKPLSAMALEMMLRRMKSKDVTVHGFRSSFRDWASECTNFSNEACEAALAHVIKDKAEAAYRRGDLFEKRRKPDGGLGRLLRRPEGRQGRGASPIALTVVCHSHTVFKFAGMRAVERGDAPPADLLADGTVSSGTACERCWYVSRMTATLRSYQICEDNGLGRPT